MGEVRIVWVWAQQPGAVWDACFRLLCREEQARALRTRQGLARDEFVTGRAMLRVLLGQMLQIAPREVTFRAGEHGKPEVDGVRFNVTHAHGLIGLAFTDAGAVGVDVEWLDRTVEAREIARAHFSREDSAAVDASADAERTFFELWTSKEAALKAVSVGLGTGLETLDGRAGDCVQVGDERVFLQRLAMQEITDGELWVGHVALAGMRPLVRMELLEVQMLLAPDAEKADRVE